MHSMHSKIEKKSKFAPVYTPEGWAQVIRCARINPRPFEVTFLTYDQIVDFATLSQTLKKAIPWRKVCTILFTKSDAGSVEIKYKEDYEEEFKAANYKQPKGWRRTNNGALPTAYGRMLSISNAKYKDLMKMCSDGIIPEKYHPYFKSLQPSAEIKDKLPEPDRDEDSEYEERWLSVMSENELKL